MQDEARGDVCQSLDRADNTTCTLDGAAAAKDPSECLYMTAVMWAPTAYFWLVIPFYLLYLMSQGKDPVKLGTAGQIKMFITILLAALTAVQLLWNDNHNQACEELTNTPAAYYMDWTRIGIFALVVMVLKFENSRGYSNPIPLFLFWSLMLATSCLSVYNNIADEMYTKEQGSFILALSYLVVVLVQLVLCTFRGDSKTPTGSESEKHLVFLFHDHIHISEQPPHPEDSASFISDLFLDWIIGLLKIGYQRKLEEDDVPDVSHHDMCNQSYPGFEKNWKEAEKKYEHLKELERTKHKKDDDYSEQTLKKEKKEGDDTEDTVTFVGPNVIYVLMKTFGLRYGLFQFLKCLLEVANFLDPLFLEAIMKHIQNRENEPVWKGYALVILMFVMCILKNTFHHRVWVANVRVCRRMSASLKLAVYNKALSATNESKKYLTSGELVSLIGEDVDKLIGACYPIFLILQTPLKVSLAIYFLYCQLGMATFVGFAIMLSLIPLNSWVGKKLQRYEKKKNKVKDERVKVMNEVLNGIKVLKLYAWERSFIKKVSDIRENEADIYNTIHRLRACIDMMFRAIPYLVRFASFMVFIILGGYLDPATAFVTASLFSMLNEPFNFLALLIPNCVQAYEASKRISKFLNQKDIPEDVITSNPNTDAAVLIEDGTFKWDTSIERPTLNNINIEIPKGGLVAVVGMVGTGKSSLLSAMLGEMEKIKGNVTIQSSIAYVAQEAWIQNETLRDNIVFGSKFESKRYNKVISACALKEDFKILAAADKTEIGEKGINLSGGQKQRVSLARAVYSDADIFLLDDPLSAVDAHVGKHIFNKVIGHNSLLKDKTRILVTHGVHWLPFVDNIIVMKDGTVSETGTYKELLTHDGAFAQFLKEVFSHDEAENDIEVQQIKKNIFTRLKSLNEDEPQPASDSDDDTTIDKEQPSSDSSSEDEKTNNKAIDTDGKDIKKEDNNVDDKKTSEKKEDESNGKIIDEEEINYGSVSMEVYKEYGRAVGMKYIVLFSCIFVLLLFSRESNRLWLAKWTEDPLLANKTLIDTPEYRSASWSYLSIYGLTGGMEIIMAFFFIVVLHSRAYKAANQIHGKLLTNILQLPMSFFDTTPTGRVITRFSKDIESIDGLGGCLGGYIRCIGNVLIHLVMVCFVTPKIIVVIITITIAYYFLMCVYSASARQLRRYRSKYNAPIYSHFKETLSGTATVRAFKANQRFISKMEATIEKHMKFDQMGYFLDHWFGMKLSFFGELMAFVAGLMVVYNRSTTPSMAGIVIDYACGFVHCLGWFIYHTSHTEQELVSLERVIEYSKKPTEAAWEITESAPSAQWPESGEIVLNDYQARYRDGLDLVLKGVTCNIHSGEKIGIVGRTGAGKSSLTVALFRIVEAAAGSITIDDSEISVLGLHDLRKKITILPQDPVIFGGSLRMNLDPFNEKTTEELWEALSHSHLKSFVDSLPENLEYDCGEGGKNLSVGQRQLVCLARTLLRKTKVLVLDEATAAVDMETDELIQKTICNEFKECTVLTIAHRLNTIMDYDRILVLDAGRIKEFDSPKNLLADTNSVFYSMAKDANLLPKQS